ncbi:hypothetical protein BH10PSE19_BH10PSE19_00210 [soil metagenome]
MKTSCVSHPSKDSFIIIRTWQVEFCHGDHCAAALLSFFTYFHDLKSTMALKNKRSNDVAEMHGETRTQDETTLQFHTVEELMDKTLHLFGKNKIRSAIELLESLGVISTHKNPNARYAFDKTKYFQLHPEVCNHWLATFNQAPETLDPESTPRNPKITVPSAEMGLSDNVSNNAQTLNHNINFTDQPNGADRTSQKELRSSHSGRPSPEKGQAITKITFDNTFEITSNNSNHLLPVDKSTLASAATASNQNHVPLSLDDNVMLLANWLNQNGLSVPIKTYHGKDGQLLRTLLLRCQGNAKPIQEALLRAVSYAKKPFGLNYVATTLDSMRQTDPNTNFLNKNVQSNTNAFTDNHNPPRIKASRHISNLLDFPYAEMQAHAQTLAGKSKEECLAMIKANFYRPTTGANTNEINI